MKAIVLVVMAIIVTCATVAAPTTSLTLRQDLAGEKPTDVVIINAPNDWEIWGIGLNQDQPTLRIGKFEQVGHFRLGGYAAVKDEKLVAIPAVQVGGKAGDAKTFACVEGNLPLSGGNSSLNIAEARVLWHMGDGVEFGVAGHGLFQDGKEPVARVGLAIKAKIDGSTSAYVRWLPVGTEPAALRAQVSYNF